MKSLRTKSAPALDQPAFWHKNLKPWFDVEAYQKRINDRVGLSRTGRPIVRLVWGQSVWQVTFGESTPRYWLKRLKSGSNFIWYTIPRWIFERRIEPEQYTEAWNATRYALKDPTEGVSQRCDDCGSNSEPELIAGKLYCRSCAGTNISGGVVIDKGPPPKEFYTWMMECADHEGMTDPVNAWPLCCTRQFYTDRRRCWGSYRAPSDFDLTVLEQTTRAMNEAKFRDPYRPLTRSELAEIELMANMQVERAQLQFEEYERQLQAEVLRTFPSPDFELGAGHFSDPGPSFAKGAERGIILTDAS